MAEPKGPSATVKKHLNEGIVGLEKFDYNNMTGKMYKEYIDLVQGKIILDEDGEETGRRGNGLPDKQYSFDVYNVRPKTKRLYPKSTIDNTRVPDGFTIFQSKPVSVGTKVFLRHALALNESLYSNIGGANNNPILYYVLQQPKNN